MARAEATGVDNFLHIELCDSSDCTCRASAVAETNVPRVGEDFVEGPDITTTVYTSAEYAVEKPIILPGVHRPEEIAEAFNDCGGPVRLESGEIVCGAINTLRQMRNDGQ